MSGAQELAKSLVKNKSVKFLNLFNNKIGYDGALEFGKTLSTNSTLEFIEFGHNRIRNKGLLAIGEGISKNPNTSISTLGLCFNFLSDDGIIDFLKQLFSGKQGSKCKVSSIYVKNNSVNEYGLFSLKRAYDGLNIKVNIDLFDKLKYLDTEKLDRTIWVHPLVTTRHELKHFFETTQKCGIVVDVRIRKGPKWPNRT